MRAADHNASGIIIVNYANQVVRMDMKQLIDQNKKIVALSMYKTTGIEIMMAMLDMNSTFYLELYPSVSLLSCLESVSTCLITFLFAYIFNELFCRINKWALSV